MTDLPAPVPETDNEPFWEYLRAGELRVQRCASCDRFRHPPRPACGACGSFEVDWATMSGRGSVYSYIVSHQAVHPALADKVPFATVIVELDEGPRLTTNLVDVEPADIEIGQRVELAPTVLNDKITLPLFRAAG